MWYYALCIRFKMFNINFFQLIIFIFLKNNYFLQELKCRFLITYILNSFFRFMQLLLLHSSNLFRCIQYLWGKILNPYFRQSFHTWMEISNSNYYNFPHKMEKIYIKIVLYVRINGFWSPMFHRINIIHIIDRVFIFITQTRMSNIIKLPMVIV